jgi:hypothetical protein
MNRRTLLSVALTLACLRPLLSSPEDIPGLRYEHRKADGPESIHVLEVDPHVLRIESVRALDDGVGRETVSSIAQRTGALAAVNAGFFRIGGRYDGEPDGILKIRQQWFSDPAEARGAVGWRQGGEVARIGRLAMKWKLQSRGRDYPIDGINRPRGPTEAILFDWAFHRSTLTDPDGTEFLIAHNKITGIWRKGNAGIPVDGFVYSLGPQSTGPAGSLKVNAPVKIAFDLNDVDETAAPTKPGWQAMDFIVGGMPALFLNRRVIFESNSEKMREGFDTERHPRTAIGLRPDGTWVFVIVDGRQPELSVGMSLKELTQVLFSLGCVDALNLDGGGSSTLFYRGQVVNSPSDTTKERPVSDAIVILRK